ncbi:MAG: AI-2E family transporter [Rhodospirillales bacterium]|nr:MAG: AI-2E family transporter [Rhodospirillales bacterium]
MSANRRSLLPWILIAVIAAALLYLLRGAIWPFLAGMAIAYLFDPVADRLERLGLPRSAAAAVIVITVVIFLIAVAVILGPLLLGQLTGLLSRAPRYFDQLTEFARPLVATIRERLGDQDLARLQDVIQEQSGEVVAWLGRVIAGILTSGLVLFQLLSVLVIMPLIAFFLLRDWDRIIAYIDSLVPPRIVGEVRIQAQEIDHRLAAYLRGMSLMCLMLAAWYGTMLSILGLDFGLVVGIGAGLISFIPYVGTAVGIGAAMGIAIAQFSDWLPVLGVAAVFLVGQVVQDYVLYPKLLGDRVGLHPAWVLFALIAGGSLLGFTGVLLAIPAAAVIGVLARHAIRRYRASGLYGPAGASAGDSGRSPTKVPEP